MDESKELGEEIKRLVQEHVMLLMGLFKLKTKK
jgi:hypothetical protein